jgi:hypothetical protein
MSWENILKSVQVSKPTYDIVRELYYDGIKYSPEGEYLGNVQHYKQSHIVQIMRNIYFFTVEYGEMLGLSFIDKNDLFDRETEGILKLKPKGEAYLDTFLEKIKPRLTRAFGPYFVLEGE